MRSGDLDRQIVIEERPSGNDEYGEENAAWTTFATVRCQVIEEPGTEGFPNRERIAEAKAQFKIRWLAGIDPKMRISYNSLTYDIISLKELAREEGIIIQASAQVR